MKRMLLNTGIVSLMALLWLHCAHTPGKVAAGAATSQKAASGDDTVPSIVETRYKSGELHERYEAFRRQGRSVMHGLYTMWSEEGEKLLEYENRDGKRHGNYRSFYPGDRLEMECIYVEGQQDGPATWRYENGRIQREETWARGVKHGAEKLYHDNGKIRFEGAYDNGQPHGVFSRFYPNGNLEATGEYDRGRLLREEKAFPAKR